MGTWAEDLGSYVSPEEQAKANLYSSPDKVAEDPEDIAKRLGYTSNVIALDPKGFAAQAKQQEANKIIDASPAVAGYLAANPVYAQVSRDDLPVLAKIGDAFSSLGKNMLGAYLAESYKTLTGERDWEKAFSHGYQEQDINRMVSADLAFSKPAREEWESLRSPEGLSPIAETVGTILGSTLSSMKAGAVGAAAGAIVGPGGAVAGFGVGFIGDQVNAWFGNNYRTLDAVRDNEGKPLSEPAKILASVGAATVAAALGGVVGGKVIGDSVNLLTSKVLSKALESESTSGILTRAAYQVFHSGVTFGAITAGIQAGTILSNEITKAVSPQDFETVFNDPLARGKALGDIVKAALPGAIMGGFLGVIPAGINIVLDRAKIGQTDFHAQAMGKAIAAAEESMTPKGSLGEFIKNHAEIPTVRVNAQGLEQVRPDYPGIAETKTFDGEVEIPPDVFYTQFTPEEQRALILHTVGQSGISQVEAQELAARPPESYATSIRTMTPEEESLGPVAAAQLSETQRNIQQLWLGPMVDLPKTLGMTQPDFIAYSKLIQQRQLELTSDAMKMGEKEYARFATKAWKAGLEEERGKATETVNARPDVQAHEMLIKGDVAGKLNEVEVKKIWGDASSLLKQYYGAAKDIPRHLLESAYESPLQGLAELAGYKSSSDMIVGLLEMQQKMQDQGENFAAWRKRTVDETAQRTMEDKHGNLQDHILNSALDSAMSVKQLDVLINDYEALSTKLGNASLTKQIILDDARLTFEKLSQAAARNVKGFSDAIAKHGQRAQSYLLDEKPDMAFQEKQWQIKNFALLSEAKNFAKAYGRTMDQVVKFARNPQVAGIEQSWKDAIDLLLQNHQVRTQRDTSAIQENLGVRFREFTQLQDENGRGVALNSTTDAINPPALQDMNARQFLDFKDTLDSMVFRGKDEERFMVGGNALERQDTLNALDIQFQDITPARLTPDKTKGFAHGLKSIDSWLLKVPQLGDFIDENSVHGIWNRVVARPMKAAQYLKDDILEVTSKAWAKLSKYERPNRKLDNTTLMDQDGKPFALDVKGLRMMILNLGNESNYRMLAEGRKWAPVDIEAVIKEHSTKEDWQYAQGIWDSFKKLEPLRKAAYKEYYGILPTEIKGRTITNDFGTWAGGYFPLISNRTLDQVLLEKGIFERLVTDPFADARSFHDRTGAMYPVDLTFDMLPSRMRETIHAITHRVPVREAWKLIQSDQFQRGIKDKFGPEYNAMFRPWMEYIANDGGHFDGSTPATINNWLSQQRLNTVAFLVGTRPSTTLIHSLSALLNSIGETTESRTKYFWPATRDLLMGSERTKKYWHDFVDENSGEIRNRGRSLDRDMRIGMERSLGKSTFERQQQFYSLALISKTDLASAEFVWLAEYRRALAEGEVHEDAIAVADKAVQQAHGSSAPMDLAAIQRGGEVMKQFTTFYGYFNHNYNRERAIGRGLDQAWNTRNGTKMLTELARLSSYVILPSLVHSIVRHDPEHEENMFVAKSLISQQASMLPGIRDAWEGWLHHRDSSVPEMAMISKMIKPFDDFYRDKWEDKNNDPNYVKDLLGGSALISGLFPNTRYSPGLVNQTTAGWAQGLYDTSRGKQNFWDLLRDKKFLLEGKVPK